MNQTQEGQWVGIDVSKKKLDVYVCPTYEIWKFKNNAVEIAKLIDQLKEYQVNLIVLEAKGGMERAAESQLIQAESPVVVVNLKRVRDFAKATGKKRENGSLGCEGPGTLC